MSGELWATVDTALGLSQDTSRLSIWQMSLRAVLIFLAGVTLVRLSDKRLLGKLTTFDVILGIIIGSVLSRAINGSAPFFPTIGAAGVLMGLYWLFAALSYRFHRVSVLLKGSPHLLIENGQFQRDAMRRSHISEGDLRAGLRLNGGVSDPDRVRLAYLERQGDISVITHDAQPRILEVKVEDGVQTIRIHLSGG